MDCERPLLRERRTVLNRQMAFPDVPRAATGHQGAFLLKQRAFPANLRPSGSCPRRGAPNNTSLTLRNPHAVTQKRGFLWTERRVRRRRRCLRSWGRCNLGKPATMARTRMRGARVPFDWAIRARCGERPSQSRPIPSSTFQKSHQAEHRQRGARHGRRRSERASTPG